MFGSRSVRRRRLRRRSEEGPQDGAEEVVIRSGGRVWRWGWGRRWSRWCCCKMGQEEEEEE